MSTLKSWTHRHRTRPGLLNVIAIGAALLTGLWSASPVAAAESCTSAFATPGWHRVTLHSGGQDRVAALYLPASAIGHSALPLLLDLHGSGGNAEQQAMDSALWKQADAHGFVLLNPNGGIADPRDPTQAFYWYIPGVPLFGDVGTPAQPPDDVQFIRDALDQIGAAACIDARRVYVAGFSGGARMASLLACQMADRIAAIAPVAGLRAGLPSQINPSQPDPSSCTPTRPVPILTFHGVNDPTNPFAGDSSARWRYGVPAALRRWAKIDACQTSAVETPVSKHVTRIEYPGCHAGVELILYRTDAPLSHGGGHIWPHPTLTGAAAAQSAFEQVDDLDASALMWAFFARHHL